MHAPGSPGLALSAKQIADGLKHQIKVKADGLVALVNQIQPRLGGHTDAAIGGIGVLCRGAAFQQGRFVAMINDRGQPRHTRT